MKKKRKREILATVLTKVPENMTVNLLKKSELSFEASPFIQAVQCPVYCWFLFKESYMLVCYRGNVPVITLLECYSKGKAVPLQAWSGPEGSRELRFPDFTTTAQDGGKVVALRTGHLYPQEIILVLISV
jgi:hypothetical protein